MKSSELQLQNLNALFMVPVLPVALCGFSVVALGLGAFVTIDGRAWALAHELHAGTLTPASITEYSGWVRRYVMATTAIGALLVPLSAAASFVVLRRVVERIDAAVIFAENRLRGQAASLVLGHTDCGLGRIERCLVALSHAIEERDDAFQAEAQGARLEGELQRALELVDDEADVMDVTVRALFQVVPEGAVELLLADSSQAHLRRAVATPAMPHVGCAVASPNECAAVRRGSTLMFASSEALDACPRTRGRAVGGCSAVCTPVTVMGRTIGVMHLQGDEHTLPSAGELRHFQSIAANVGTRLGVLRTLAETQRAARTDPLTGLMNRRTFEAEATRRMANVGHGLLVMADIDHFKRLNDTHGHQTGDRAICLYSRVIREGLREDIDLVARYGGEEFILLLPGLDLDAGLARLEAVRKRLDDALRGSEVPRFTCSMGVAQFPVDGDSLHALTQVADTALYAAKRNGRDRIEVALQSEIAAAAR